LFLQFHGEVGEVFVKKVIEDNHIRLPRMETGAPGLKRLEMSGDPQFVKLVGQQAAAHQVTLFEINEDDDGVVRHGMRLLREDRD
jgi:uncharacterized membrane protein